MAISEYDDLDTMGLAELVRSKEVKPEELLDEALARAGEWNPKLNAIVCDMEAQAREAIAAGLPEGPFTGVPFVVKDLIAMVAGVPLTSGSRFFKDFVPNEDSELVRRFRKAGLVIFAKTNTPEFGLMPVTEPVLFGPCRNPWDTSRTPGGSSGGTGALVGARVVPSGSGGDGGGSIRIPSSACGLVGLKPNRGRIPTGPHLGDLWYGFATEGVLTRTVRDSAAFLDAVAGPDPGPPSIAPANNRPFLEEVRRDPGKLRIAFSTDKMLGGSALDPEVVTATKNAATLLESLGHDVVEATPDVDAEQIQQAFMVMIAADTAALIHIGEMATGKKATAEEFEHPTWSFREQGLEIRAVDFCLAFQSLQQVARKIGAFHETYDVLLTPTLGKPPIPVGSLQGVGDEDPANDIPVFDWIPWTPLQNIAGTPSISLPLHWTKDGLPVGVMLSSRFGDEATLLRLSGQLEQAAPWSERKP